MQLPADPMAAGVAAGWPAPPALPRRPVRQGCVGCRLLCLLRRAVLPSRLRPFCRMRCLCLPGCRDLSTGDAIRIYSGHHKACTTCALNDSAIEGRDDG